MRPLAVLLLVIAAIAALMFALLASDADPRTAEPAQSAAAPVEAEPAPRPAAELRGVERQVATPDEPERTETRRQPEGEASGSWPNRVTGTVKSPDGDLLADAVVTLDRTGLPGGMNTFAALFADKSEEKQPTWSTKTNSEGVFEIKNVTPGNNYTLVARKNGFGSVEAAFIVVPEEGDVIEDMQLAPGFLVHGYVRNDQSQPIAGATINFGSLPLFAGMPQREDPERRQAVSDGRGYYRFDNASPGSRTVSVTAMGYGSQTTTKMVGGKPSAEIDFRLSAGLRIAGRVVGPSEEPIVGAQIEAIMYKAELTSRGETVSVEKGEFVIEDLSAGQYQLVVSAPGWSVERLNRVEAGQTDVVVKLKEQGGVEGRVVDNQTGDPVRGFTCSVRFVNAESNVYGRSVAQQQFSGRTDGTFRMTGIEHGTYAVQASAPGYAPTYSPTFNIAEGQLTPNVEVRLMKGGAVRGTILDGTTGKPISGAEIVTNENNWIDSPFTQLLGSTMARNTTVRKVRTNANGEFLLKNLAPQTYQIKISHGDHTAEVINDLLVTDGLTFDMGPVRLRAGAVVEGTVYDAAGRPLPGAQINVTPLSPGAHASAKFYQVRADRGGRYMVRNVASGEYKVSAARPPGSGGQTGSPFDSIIDMKNSETQLTVIEGGQFVTDLYLGE